MDTRGMGGQLPGYQGDGWLPGGWVATRGIDDYQGDGGYQGNGWLTRGKGG